jgi:ABC-type multidrug transport system fused ATPase/permease subunit
VNEFDRDIGDEIEEAGEPSGVAGAEEPGGRDGGDGGVRAGDSGDGAPGGAPPAEPGDDDYGDESPVEEERPAPRLTFREHVDWLWRYWVPHRHVLIFLAFFTLVSTAVAVAYPLVFRSVIDRVSEMLEAGDASTDISGIMLTLGLILVGYFVSRLYPATRAMMNARLERDVRDDVFGELMDKDYHFNNRFRTGDVVTRLTDDIAEFPKIAWFACSGIFRAVESSSKLIFCLAAMLMMSWKLTLLSIVPLPVMMWIFYGLRHKMRYYMEASQQSVSKTNNLLEAAFSGVRIVKAFSAEDAQERKLAAILRERIGVLLGLVKLQVVMFSLDTFASRLGQMVVIAYGGFLVIRGELSIGTIFAFYVYLDMLTGPMMDVPFLFMTGQQAFVSVDRVEEIRGYPVTETRPAGRKLEDIRELTFENVSFSYDGTRQNVDSVDFTIPLGKRVAVVGPVASGKSTVLKIVAGILVPQEGRILVNGEPLTEWNWDSYRRRIGYVPQEALLFSKSIQDNVTFGRRPPSETESDEWVVDVVPPDPSAHDAAARESGPASEAERRVAESWARYCLSVAQMDSDLATFPNGIGTVVGQKGGLVSGGQKQRIAIARALAGRPRVLLLDDCTAALDAQNEDRFWTQLDEEFGEGICFVVSHRLATIRRADSILVLDDGKLVDQGRHEELVRRCETYRAFLQTEEKLEHLGATGVEYPSRPRRGGAMV